MGFGDLLNATDAALLRRATRADGVLLKPAFPIMRLDRWYTTIGGAEIWGAVTGPAASVDARADARANSKARLLDAEGEPGALWWWQVRLRKCTCFLPSHWLRVRPALAGF